MSHSLLVAGTTSDAGKTVITTAICRALARRGMRVAPFKAQNMSNNSMVTRAGAEIGRAQWIQAVAAGATPEPAMNPVLLKPSSDLRSQVVVMGEAAGRLEAQEYAGGRAHLRDAAFAAFDDLSTRFDAVICEGAGGIAEINLRPWDYVNLGLAQHGSIPTIVVGDIDRGGVFASLYGSLAVLDEADQRLVTGFLINRFRGDPTLLTPGLDRLRALTGRPTYGVVPWADGMWLDSEDALALDSRPRRPEDHSGALRVAVMLLPRISNFTDIDALTLEPDVDVSFVRGPAGLVDVDLIVIPGTRATVKDLGWLRSRGLDRAIRAHARAGRPVLGICGGCQMLGSAISDADGVEGESRAGVTGLGLLDVSTTFEAQKTLRLVEGVELGTEATGYLIHHGRIRRGAHAEPFLDGARNHTVYGTMWHGVLESDGFRRAFLTEVAGQVGRRSFRPDPQLSFAAARLTRIDRLADLLEQHVDVDALVDLVRHGVPAGAPFIPSGPR
ncbi:cobyric acid synthase [Leekyejoonella antrihumi]|uniref:Cobyric acid synthase n=1 Tax=Leekyejoonella antrihumi TaxID=1660198 RepID=A0A563E4A3_9MICO|nr:cobyric acid synthase [Leekyejoonella antrihumi]TWP37358.1 cobyric acid synthase [Leekyejoonella antrihumi]